MLNILCTFNCGGRTLSDHPIWQVKLRSSESPWG